MAITASSPFPIPTLTFRLSNLNSPSKFSPRVGLLTLIRASHGTPTAGGTVEIEVPTPGFLCSTTRGVIQHLSRDNVKRTASVKWIHVPFESFLQLDPPVPTRQEGKDPLHNFLGFSPSHHIVSMSLRDPADGREMPANGKLFVAAQSSRGARKITCPAYRSYVAAVLPDIVFPLSDVPFTPPPHSQKRIHKSIERSAQWLTTILAPLNLTSPSIPDDNAKHTEVPRFNIFLPMVGGISTAARAAFSAILQEPLDQREKELLAPLETLDEGVSGYVFDLVTLRTALLADPSVQLQALTPSLLPHATVPTSIPRSLTASLVPLIKASLTDLPVIKPRLVNTVISPHEILALIRDAGIDLFDTWWAQRAATWGVALDFRFPVPREEPVHEHAGNSNAGSKGKHDVGHNLYEGQYAHDFGRLADSFLDGLEFSKRQRTPETSQYSGEVQFCACAACSPAWENDPVTHSMVDDRGTVQTERGPPYTRAYLHHLLHTHEMSAHALLVMHNLTVMDAFMHGVRAVLQQDLVARVEPEAGGEVDSYSSSLFAMEVARFEETYDADLRVVDEARVCWAEVDRVRGKGRLARERAKKLADELNLEVPVDVGVDVDILQD